ncbi:uncharacterized protein BJ212DRAFT_1297390 [Suillus subaureus]|uniref:Uncharacterized protein n=1 Tax=Suillus subaureus TaxID=48587 RepID=A0A9P7EH60_9AGAM|nr:uncharacterized protein BJ212DRAFT_1297390 [Suillus subaureus]KAG1820900.1 hypothetical protein BJ212DRAFT_1297390 [Suillus subaureus]
MWREERDRVHGKVLREQRHAWASKEEMVFNVEVNTPGTRTKGVEWALYPIKTVHQVQAVRWILEAIKIDGTVEIMGVTITGTQGITIPAWHPQHPSNTTVLPLCIFFVIIMTVITVPVKIGEIPLHVHMVGTCWGCWSGPAVRKLTFSKHFEKMFHWNVEMGMTTLGTATIICADIPDYHWSPRGLDCDPNGERERSALRGMNERHWK